MCRETERLAEEELLALAEGEEEGLQDLMRRAAKMRDSAPLGNGSVITFSPKVFLPVTRLCRDSCGYCTFAAPPPPAEGRRRLYMTVAEAVEVARAGAEAGCTEALLTLGDKPELLYPEAAAELAEMGHSSTLGCVGSPGGERRAMMAPTEEGGA